MRSKTIPTKISTTTNLSIVLDVSLSTKLSFIVLKLWQTVLHIGTSVVASSLPIANSTWSLMLMNITSTPSLTQWSQHSSLLSLHWPWSFILSPTSWSYAAFYLQQIPPISIQSALCHPTNRRLKILLQKIIRCQSTIIHQHGNLKHQRYPSIRSWPIIHIHFYRFTIYGPNVSKCSSFSKTYKSNNP